MAFGAENIQTANGANLVALFLALCLVNRKQCFVTRESSLTFGLKLFGHFVDWCRQSEIVDQQSWIDTFCENLLAGKKFGVSTKENVDTSASHVCCNSDCSEPTSLSNNLGLTGVLLCIQYFMTNAALGQLASKILALFDTDGADKNRLTLCMTLGDVFDDGFELRELGLVDEVWLINAHDAAVGRNRHHLQGIGVDELGSFCLRRTGHTRQLFVHAEIVLQCDCCQCLVLFVDANALFGFDCLVNSFAPATTLENSAGEFIDNLYFAGVNDVILVAAVQLFGAQSNCQLVHKVLLHCVVQVVEPQLFFNFFDTGFGRNNNPLAFIYFVINVASQDAHDGRKLVIHGCCVGNTARDDQRCTGFVDQDAVYFVDNCEIVTTLHLVVERASHVVAQVIKTEFIIRAVGDVAGIVVTLFCRRLAQSRNNETNVQTHELMDATHPLSMEASEVIVDGDDVDALAGQSVEIRRQCRNKCLALACLHLGYPTKMQSRSTHQLNVEMALSNDSARRFTHHSEGFNQEVV